MLQKVIPPTPNAFPGVVSALADQADAIADNYLNGNISTAKAMFAQVPARRKAFVTMLLLDYVSAERKPDMQRFICLTLE